MTPALAHGLGRRLADTLSMIRFSHSIFALPFALLAAVLAAGGLPPGPTLGWIVLACVLARSAAMAFNRLHDERFDRLNPRTQTWELPSGRLSRGFVVSFCAVCSAGFIACAWMLNPLAFCLSFPTLGVLLGYSTAKRWTRWSHFVLGMALGIAPSGAWIGVRGSLDWPPIILGAAVLLWVAGFDIIYSCQDAAFDRRIGLRSLPSRLGKRRALAISALCHAGALVLFWTLAWHHALGQAYLLAVAIAGGLLAYEQSLITPRDLSRLNRAFFTLNGWVSVLIFLGGWFDVWRAGH
jgi:4-hydroxybenzoate polyprenyltransferase